MKVKRPITLVIMLIAVLVSCDKEEEPAKVPDGYFKGVILKDSVVVDSFAVSFAGNLNTTGYEKNCAYSAVTDSLKISLLALNKWQIMVNVKMPGPVGMGLFAVEENSGSYFADSSGKVYHAVEGELAITHSNKIKESNGTRDYFSDGKLAITFADSLKAEVIEFIADFDNIRMRAE